MTWRRGAVLGAWLCAVVSACSSSEDAKPDPACLGIVCEPGSACREGTCYAGDTATCPTDNPECKALSTVSAGKQAVEKRKCVDCHGADMSGSLTALSGFPPTALGEEVELYPPNLTPDPKTGAASPDKGGKWTDDALALAITTGVDYQSQTLCPQMKHFSEMSEFEVFSIVKYLRSLPPVSKAVPRSVCPPLKTKDQQSLGR